MSTGLIGSLINPNTIARGEVMQRGNTAYVPPVAEQGAGLQRASEQASELPRTLSRVGPRDAQALSQYAEFSGQSLAGAGSGFSAVI